MAAIDIHCHIIPESCLPMEAVGPDGRIYGRLERRGSPVERPGARRRAAKRGLDMQLTIGYPKW
jgi:hypothetical protein